MRAARARANFAWRVSERSAEYSFVAGFLAAVVFFFAVGSAEADPAWKKRAVAKTPIQKVGFVFNFGSWILADNS